VLQGANTKLATRPPGEACANTPRRAEP
jgi:hypothetical protein